MVYLIYKNKILSKEIFFLLVAFILFFNKHIEADSQVLLKNNPRDYLSKETFEDVQDYLIPDDHPIKKKLDKIFSNKRVMANLESMIDEGFNLLQSKHLYKIIVAKHRKIPGYVIKAYLDGSPKERSHYTFLIKRIQGCQLVKESINKHNYHTLFKTTNKWLYLVSNDSTAQEDSSRTLFIIVENEIDIVKEKKNEKLWASPLVTKKILKAMYTVMTEVGLGDVKPRNCPFCKDGRIAFIDTECCKTIPKHEKLLPYLSTAMTIYWSKLNNGNPDQ